MNARALSLWQPSATFVALGVKWIETRPWPTKYRGRLLIHAAQRVPYPERGPMFVGAFHVAQDGTWLHGPGHNEPMSFGAVVASATLTDCVPIYDGTDRSLIDLATVAPCVSWDGNCGLYLLRTAGSDENEQIDDQLPFGDFSPGRWAWLLDDVKPTTERCPRCWGRGEADGIVEEACPTCDGAAKREPVPMRGWQGLWTPKWEAA